LELTNRTTTDDFTDGARDQKDKPRAPEVFSVKTVKLYAAISAAQIAIERLHEIHGIARSALEFPADAHFSLDSISGDHGSGVAIGPRMSSRVRVVALQVSFSRVGIIVVISPDRRRV
jgi:hypothetical protein